MRMGILLPALLLVAGTHARTSDAGTKVRSIKVKKDQIVVVKTAPTIATIIQVPDRPNSVVLGNQSAFQVEYLDTAVTVKSLVPRSRGNLYIYTDYRRYSVELVTGDEGSADYIIYLDEPRSPTISPRLDRQARMRWKSVSRKASRDGLTIEVQRIGERADGFYLIEFTLESRLQLSLDPAWFWAVQGGKTRPIQNLFLNRLEIPSRGKVSGTLVLVRKEVEGKDPIRVEIRRKRTLSISTPKVTLWK